MRKLILTLLLGLTLFGIGKAQTVIFDPSAFTGDLPAGMSIVDVNGTDYLQVVVDGWNSTLNVPEVASFLGTQFAANIKFMQGTPTTEAGLTLDKIATAVQIMDTVNRVPNPWGEGTIPSATTLGGNPSIDAFNYYKKDITAEQKMVHQIQFFGQETVNWGPTVGDTIWVGKIVSIDASIMFDPASFAGDLPEGMEIVDEDGTKLLKVKVNGWNTNLAIPGFETGKNNKMKLSMKYDAGTSGFEAANVQAFVQPTGDGTGLFAATLNPAPTALTEVEVDAKAGVTVDGIQFAVQQTSGNWDAISDAFLYISKITVSYEEAVLADAPNTTTLAYAAAAKDIEIDGLYDDAYDLSAANVTDRVALNETGGDIPKESSYGEWLAVADLENFYFFIEINDDDMFDLGESTSPWMNDGIELFVDIQNRRYLGASRISGEQHQFRVNLGTDSPLHGDGGDGVSFGMDAFFGDNDTTNIEYAIIKGSLGYTIEMRIPWATWFRTSSNTTKEALDMVAGGLTENMKIAFEVSILDANAVDGRQSILNWANNTGEDKAYQTNEYYGEVTLTGGWPVGIREKLSVANLEVYPNPASDQITLAMENIRSVEVYNLLGAQVLNAQMHANAQLNISSLNTGVYIVKATDANGKVAVAKFNKN